LELDPEYWDLRTRSRLAQGTRTRTGKGGSHHHCRSNPNLLFIGTTLGHRGYNKGRLDSFHTYPSSSSKHPHRSQAHGPSFTPVTPLDPFSIALNRIPLPISPCPRRSRCIHRIIDLGIHSHDATRPIQINGTVRPYSRSDHNSISYTQLHGPFTLFSHIIPIMIRHDFRQHHTACIAFVYISNLLVDTRSRSPTRPTGIAE
jgi:hypothetical protein